MAIILELEELRSRRLGGLVPPYIFFQLKAIFQIMETLGSARIEGNRTTLAEYVEQIMEGQPKADEPQKEIANLDAATAWIEKNTTPETPIDRAYVSELHKIVTGGLTPPPN